MCHFGSSTSKVSSQALVRDAVVGAALVVAIITSVGGRVLGSGHSLLADVAWVVLLFIFSFTEPRKCKLYLDRIHVATNEEIIPKMDESYPSVLAFMCDPGLCMPSGVKEAIKSNPRALV